MALINIHGVRLEVQHIPASPPTRAANAALAPLVFLHEGLGSVAMWRDWPAAVCAATGRAGMVYSRRGYGQSEAVPDVRGPSRLEAGQRVGRLLPDYLHVEAFEVLPALLPALNIVNPVLIGHSDGGSIALLYASRFPVAACVVMAPHVMVEDISIASITQAKTAFETHDLRQRLARYHADVDGAFWQWNDVWLSPGFRSFDIRAECRRITAPLLAIQGFDDPYGSMAHIDGLAARSSDALEKRSHLLNKYKHAQLFKLEQCGHSPHRDQADKTTACIAGFLATPSTRTPACQPTPTCFPPSA